MVSPSRSALLDAATAEVEIGWLFRSQSLDWPRPAIRKVRAQAFGCAWIL
jgi:hypothetical protein